jgi:predicted CXXCH cytochrome family protein
MSAIGRVIGRGIKAVLALSLLLTSLLLHAGYRAKPLHDLKSDFVMPSAVGVAASGTAYVLDGVKGRVVMFDSSGKRFGEFSAPEATPFNMPMDLRIQNDRLVVSDSGNHRLLLFTMTGDYVREYPLSQDDQEYPPEPTGMAIIEDLVYWSDRANSRLCVTSLESGETLSCWGGFGTRTGAFRYPFMMAVDQDRYLHVVDVLNGRIQIFNRRGQSFGALERFGVMEEGLLRPNGLVIDKQQTLMVSDAYSGIILQFTGRSFSGVLKDETGRTLRFNQPVGLARWQNRLYVVEMGDNRVRVFYITPQQSEVKQKAPGTFFNAPVKRDCVTCHLSWSDDYKATSGASKPMLPVGSKAMCMSCHHGAVRESRTKLSQGEQHPDYYHPNKTEYFQHLDQRVDPIDDDYPILANGEPYCGTCHTPHLYDEEDTGLRHGKKNVWMRNTTEESGLCRDCHESLYADSKDVARKAGKHPVAIDLDEPVRIGSSEVERVECLSCHRAHGAGQGSALLVVARREMAELCAICHPRQHAESLEEARHKGVHPVNVDLEESVTIEEREITRLDCLSCHSVHNGTPKTPSLVMESLGGGLCERCHGAESKVTDTPHDLRIGDSESRNRLDEIPKEAGLCGSCHSMHRTQDELPYLFVGARLPSSEGSSHLTRDRLCQGCHQEAASGEKHVVAAFTHPYRDLVMRSDPETMPLLDDSEQVDESGQIACMTCHDPHAWSPRRGEKPFREKPQEAMQEHEGTVLDSFLRLKHAESGFCVECHGLEVRIKYKYYHDKRSRPERAKYLE